MLLMNSFIAGIIISPRRPRTGAIRALAAIAVMARTTAASCEQY